jgi:hypothetical protein
VSGKVTAVGTNSLTVLTAASTSVEVVTSSSTTVEVLATGASSTLSAIVVGTEIAVQGAQVQDGSVTARSIVILPSGDQLAGRVTAISDLTITVQTPGGTSATIVATSSTTFREGQSSAALSDVTVGQNLQAFGTLESSTSLSATVVVIQTAPMGGGGGGPGGGVSGKVTAVGTNSLTILTAASTSVEVVTSTTTTVEVLATGASSTLSAIVVGTEIAVQGAQNQDGSVTARSIMILPSGDQLAGRVTATGDLTITVQTPGGTSATIVTTSSTAFREGQSSAAFSDVTIGQNLQAFGTLESSTSLSATLVVIQTAPTGGVPGGPGGTTAATAAPGGTQTGTNNATNSGTAGGPGSGGPGGPGGGPGGGAGGPSGPGGGTSNAPGMPF